MTLCFRELLVRVEFFIYVSLSCHDITSFWRGRLRFILHAQQMFVERTMALIGEKEERNLAAALKTKSHE